MLSLIERNIDSWLISLKKDESHISFSVPGKFVLFALNVAAVFLLFAQILRNPWVDELTTFYFAESAESSLQRYAGDPHPYGYYFVVLVLNYIFGFASTQGSLLSIWPLIKIVVFVSYFLIFASLAILFSLSQIRQQPSLIWIFAVVLPSLIGFAATFGVATDLRSYGVQALGAVFIACGMVANFPRRNLSNRDVAVFALAIGLLGSLHVWSSFLAFWMFLVATIIWRASFRRFIVFGLVLTFPIYLLSYLPMFLTRDISSGLGKSGVDGLGDWVLGLAAGFSFQLLIAVPLFIVWAWFLIKGKKTIALVFDLPALLTIFLAFVISITVLPIFKWYVLAPVYALFLAATFIRVGQLNKGSFIGFIFVAAALYSSHNPMNAITDDAMWTSQGALSDKQNWSETSNRALEELASRNEVTVYSNTNVQLLSYFLPNAKVFPITNLTSEDCALPDRGEELVVVNHASVSLQQSLKLTYELIELASWPTGGVYFRTCQAQIE